MFDTKQIEAVFEAGETVTEHAGLLILCISGIWRLCMRDVSESHEEYKRRKYAARRDELERERRIK